MKRFASPVTFKGYEINRWKGCLPKLNGAQLIELFPNMDKAWVLDTRAPQTGCGVTYKYSECRHRRIRNSKPPRGANYKVELSLSCMRPKKEIKKKKIHVDCQCHYSIIHKRHDVDLT